MGSNVICCDSDAKAWLFLTIIHSNLDLSEFSDIPVCFLNVDIYTHRKSMAMLRTRVVVISIAARSGVERCTDSHYELQIVGYSFDEPPFFYWP